MSEDKDKGGLFDALDKAIDVYESNEDTIKEFFGDDNEVTIDGEEPLKQALVEEDKAIITVDVGAGDLQNINIQLEGETAKIKIGGSTVTAKVPEDVNMDDAKATINNGVLEVEIPREGGEE